MRQSLMNTVHTLVARIGRVMPRFLSRKSPPARRFWFTKEPPKKRAKILRGEAVDGSYSQHNLRGLLDDLDGVFKDLKKMTPKGGHSIQGAIKAFGPFVCGRNETDGVHISVTRLDGFKAYGLPTVISQFFPASYDGAGSDREIVKQYFVAVKINRVPGLPKVRGSIYYEAASVAFLVETKRPVSCYFYIRIDKKTGEVHPVRVPTIVTRAVGPPNRPEYIKHMVRQIPDFRSPRAVRDGETAESFMRSMFILNWNLHAFREYGASVRVRKGDLKATFIVPENRWKYFFSERIGTTGAKGRKTPIFHAVVAHRRQTSKGESLVKTHYRGTRHFWWKGYSVEISMPGKHRLAASRFNVSATIFDKNETPHGLTFAQTARMIDS